MSRGFHSKSDFLVNTYVHTFEPLSCRFMHENGDAMTALPQEEDVTDYLLNNQDTTTATDTAEAEASW